MRSAPFCAAARTAAAVVSRSGSPQVRKAMNALPWSNALARSLKKILPSVAGDGGAVLVAAAGDRDDKKLIAPHRGCELSRVGDGVGRFDGGNDALRAGEVFERLHGLLIGDGNILCAADVVQVRMLRADAG